MRVGILVVLSTQLHRPRGVHPCNSRHYAEPLLSPDNSLIFLFHLHCQFVKPPRGNAPHPWSTYSRTSASVKTSFLSPWTAESLVQRGLSRALCSKWICSTGGSIISKLYNCSLIHFCTVKKNLHLLPWGAISLMSHIGLSNT